MKPFITGSAAYGPFREDSDIDIVMLYYEADKLKIVLEEAGFEISKPNEIINPVYTGYEFNIAGRIFNIISVVNEEEYYDWAEATMQMRKNPPILDREKRIKKFQYYRSGK